jgi:hypothetical protein
VRKLPWKGNSSLNSDYFDPDAIAQEVLTGAGNTNKTSLIPSSSMSLDSLPSLPTYTAPAKESFDWNVPVSERPQGTENWIWSRSRWAKENFDNEQQAKADEAYRKYQTDLQNWQNALTLANAQREEEQRKLENYNTMLAAQGLTPMSSLSDLPSAQIRQLGQMWQSTTDPTLQNQYHQQALQIAQKAGLIPEGYTDSVNGLATLSAAGTPSYERTYKDQAYKDAMAQQAWDNDYKERELAADTAYKNAALAADSAYKNAALAAKGTNSSKATTNDYISYFMGLSSQYKTASDYKADLTKYKADLIAYVGTNGWNALYNDAVAQEKANAITNKTTGKTSQKVNPNFVSGTKSPIGTALNGNFNNPQSGSLDSWVSTAMKSAGVGSDWYEPLKWIILKESSGNPTATNSSSGAYGLMQFLPQTWKNYGYQKTSDPIKQIVAGIAYIKARYGTAANAKAFWQKNGWY